MPAIKKNEDADLIVARAFWDALADDGSYDDPPPFDELSSNTKQHYLRGARAAIEALRKLTSQS